MKNLYLVFFLISFSIVTVVSQDAEFTLIQDCVGCPELVEVPAGSVLIGSSENEIGRRKGERIKVTATIDQAFLMSQHEVTLGQFREFMEETNYKQIDAIWQEEVLVGCNYYDGKRYGYIANHSWKNPGYPQREDAPVVCVSWSDADAYCKWLSMKTGRNYRVPSAVEFEYATKAGSDAPWFWGTEPADACEYANIGDRTFAHKYPIRPSFPCDDGFVYTAAVGTFKPNAFGLYDMIGNAWEWTDDCYHPDLTNAPTDGSAWYEEDGGECIYRTPKGGSWISGIEWGRSAVRSRDGADYRSFMLGFRVVASIDK